MTLEAAADYFEAMQIADADERGANGIQIGGDHYRRQGIYQPWLVLEHWLSPQQMQGYLVGTAIAYLGRLNADSPGKGGVMDVKKAIHTLQKAVELAEADAQLPLDFGA